MALFSIEPSALQQWKGLDASARRKAFSAIKVRLKLEQLISTVPISEDRYRLLSAYSIHADPDALPQAHGPTGKAICFPTYQEAGLVMAVNEIAYPISMISLFSIKLIKMPTEQAKILKELTLELSKQIGGVQVTEVGRPWFRLH